MATFEKKSLNWENEVSKPYEEPISDLPLLTGQENVNADMAAISNISTPVPMIPKSEWNYVNLPELNQNALNESVDINTDTEEMNFVREHSNTNKNQLTAISNALFTPEQLKSFENNPIGFSEAGNFLDVEDYLPAGGLYKGYKAINIASIAEDIQEGKEISNSNQQIFDDYIRKRIEVQVRGFSWSGGVRYYGTPIPAFIVEFVLSGGYGKIAQVATTKAIAKGAMIGAEKSALAQTAGQVANVATRIATMPAQAAKNYGSLRVGERIELTENGRAILTEAKDSPAQSALKAFAYTGVEIVSEMSGAKLAQVINPATNRLATKAITTATNKLPPKLVNGLLEAYKKIKPNAVLQDVLDRAGWHGMLNELGEERIADVLRLEVDMVLGERYTFDEVLERLTPSKEQLLIEAGIIGTIKTFSSGFALGQNLLSKRNISEEDIKIAINRTSEDNINNMNDEELFIDPLPDPQEIIRTIYKRDSRGNVLVESDEMYVDTAVANELFAEYEESFEDANIKRRNNIVLKIDKKVKELKKSGETFLDFLRKSGSLSYEELLSFGFDGKDLDNITIDLGSNKKRLWVRNKNNPKISLADLAEAYNQYYNLADINANVAADKSTEVGENEIIDILNDFIRGDYKTQLMDSELQTRINELENQIDFYEQMNNSDLEVFFNEASETYLNLSEALVMDTDLSDLQYADEISEIEFEAQQAELNEFFKIDRVRIKPDITQQIEAKEVEDKIIIDNSQSTSDKILTNWSNKYHSIEKLVSAYTKRFGAIPDGLNPALLISTFGGIAGRFRSTIKHATYKFSLDGDPIKTGIGFKPIIDAFDALIVKVEPNINARKHDLNKYLIAKRIQQDLQNFTNLETGEDIVGPVIERRVSEEQKAQADLDLIALEIKYGDKLNYFETTAKELYAFQRRTLELLVDSGNMSRDQYNTIIKDNPNYIPFQRVMVENLFDQNNIPIKEAKEIFKVLSEVEVQEIAELGFMSQKQYDKIYAKNPNLAVKLNDLVKEDKINWKDTTALFTKGLFNKATSKFITQRLTGSERAIKDPLFSVVQNTYKILEIASRNEIAKSVAGMADLMPEFVQKINPKPLYDKNNNPIINAKDGSTVMDPTPPKDALEVYIDGKRTFFKVAKPIYESLNEMTVEQISWVHRLLILPITAFRVGTTITPDFLLSLLFRDQFMAAIQADKTATPIDLAQGISAMMGKTDLYYEWMASGGQMSSYMDLADTGIVDSYKELMDDNSYFEKTIKSFGLKPFKDFQQSVDEVTRISIYNAQRRNGASGKEAAKESREALADFSKSGTKAKFANRYLPFFNVAIRGTEQMISKAKKNPTLFMAKASAFITLPTVMLTGYYLYGAPDDEREEWLNFPQRTRDYNWLFKINGQWTALPKPYAPGYIFGSIPENFMVWMYKNDKPEGMKLARSVGIGALQAVSPIQDVSGVLPPPLRIYLELESNYDYWREGPVVSIYKKDLEPELQTTKYDSLTATTIGEKYNISPAKIDKIFRGVFSSAGQYPLIASDMILKQLKANVNDPVPETPDQIPLMLRRFAKDSPYVQRTETENVWWESFEQVSKVKKSVNAWEKQEKYDKANKYILENQAEFDQQYQMDDAKTEIYDLYQLINNERKIIGVSKEDKKIAIDGYKQQIFEIAKESLSQYSEAIKKESEEKK